MIFLKRGPRRLVASILLCVFLIPMILNVYMQLKPDTASGELWVNLVQTIPMGVPIAEYVIGAFTEAQSGAYSLLEWIQNQELDFSQYLSMELAEFVFTAVILMLLTNVIGKNVVSTRDKGLSNRLANGIFQVLLTFIATLLTDLVYSVFSLAVDQVYGLVHDALIYGYSASLGIIGLVLLVFSGIMLFSALLLVGVNCLKLLCSYAITLWAAQWYIQGESAVVMLLGIVLWIIALCVLQFLENLVSPN